METVNFVQIISASVAVAASTIPMHFIAKIRADRQRILSLLLFAALITYSAHTFLESFGIINNFQLFTKVCFVVSAFGLIAAYFILQLRTNHTMIGGMFGIAMVAAFGIWVAGEFVEAYFAVEDQNREAIDHLNSIVLAGFGVFVIARFYWLRSIMPVEPRYLKR